MNKVIGIIMLFGVVCLCIGFFYISNKDKDTLLVQGASIPYEEVSPENYQDLNLMTAIEAYNEANTQLDNMNVGNIQTLDSGDSEYTARLILDYEMGNIIYWYLSESHIEIKINAYSCEIIYYINDAYLSGTYTKPLATDRSLVIMQEFNNLPIDRDNPYTFEDIGDTDYDYDSDTNQTSVSQEYEYWITDVNRTLNQIPVQDYIRTILFKNGDLCFYEKNWNMDLDNFSPVFIVSSQQAEGTSLTFIGETSTVTDITTQAIIRPNDLWSENQVYGSSELGVWEVSVRKDNDLFIVDIDGESGEIVGGNYYPDHYLI